MRRQSIILLALLGLCTFAIAFFHPRSPETYLPLFVLFAVGMNDAFQTRHAVRRNFPILGNLRYLLESIRPEINQYFIESSTDGAPLNRELRSVVYQRAKGQVDSVPFGTKHDLYATGSEFLKHAMFPAVADSANLTVLFGGDHCTQKYETSVFMISAMSFGALSGRAIEALNLGAKNAKFPHNTGEGGISKYHLKHGGDLIWQIGTGYFGCRNENGFFDEQRFIENALHPQVKMIELKLSQGAKPGLGGILPGKKVTAEIAKARGVVPGVTVVSPAKHSAFQNFVGLLQFIQRLRELSGGKPIGIKLCVGSAEEFDSLCRTMASTQILPDYIAVDGAEGGTGAAPVEFTNHVGLPLVDGLVVVHTKLIQHNLREKIKLISSGRILNAFDIVRSFALGADACASARGMMLALGCIQALRCNSNHCPVGIATQDPNLEEGLVVAEKAARVTKFHSNTMDALTKLLSAAGVSAPAEIQPSHLLRRQNDGSLKSFEEIYFAGIRLEPGLDLSTLGLTPIARNVADTSIRVSQKL